MKKYVLLGFGLISCMAAGAQLTLQNGAVFTVQSAARVQVGGNVSSNKDLPGGILVMNGSSLQNLNMHNLTVNNLEINNNSNVALEGAAAKIGNSLAFVSGRLQTGSQDLILKNTAAISGAGDARFIWTNGTGHLVSNVGSSAKVFPVGAAGTSYSPVTLTNSGTADDFSVRVMPGIFSNGTTGSPITEKAVDRTWMIEEATAGGSVASVSLQWNKGDELPNFNNGTVYLFHYTDNRWDAGSAQAVTYTSNVANVTRSGITTFSPFAVNTYIGGSGTGQVLVVQGNPVRDILNVQVQGTGPAALYVIDAIGRKVREEKIALNGTSIFSMDIANLASGMYIVVLDNGSEKFQEKFVKK